MNASPASTTVIHAPSNSPLEAARKYKTMIMKQISLKSKFFLQLDKKLINLRNKNFQTNNKN